ncbi:hypothetical protein AB0I35_20305 [Nocardia sp. NPDC050378]|uniref:effector-associated constant component EACC1 n=1 Tax=Nocardia sp. NPDC050378 TaxID=3155400 RepID=UPI0033E1518C
MDVLVESRQLGGADALRDLNTELLNDARWRGRVTLLEKPAPEGTLGPVLEGLQIVLQPQTLVPLATALFAFLRVYTSDIEIDIKRTDNKTEVTLSAKRIKRLKDAELPAALAELIGRLDTPDSDNSEP